MLLPYALFQQPIPTKLTHDRVLCAADEIGMIAALPNLHHDVDQRGHVLVLVSNATSQPSLHFSYKTLVFRSYTAR